MAGSDECNGHIIPRTLSCYRHIKGKHTITRFRLVGILAHSSTRQCVPVTNSEPSFMTSNNSLLFSPHQFIKVFRTSMSVHLHLCRRLRLYTSYVGNSSRV